MTEKPTKDAAKQKQKVMMIAIGVILLIVGYQVVKMMGGGGDVTPATVPTPGNKPAMTAGNTASASSGMATPGAAPAPVVQQPIEQTQPKPAPVQGNVALLKLQQETQVKYIAALNELQMLKVQKDIAETKQAITSSTLATATAEKNITDLLTVQQAAPPTAFGNMSAPTAPQALPAPNAAPAPAPAAPVQAQKPATPDAPYTLLSVSFEGNRWTAVLSFQDKMYNVSVGDSLPPDGSIVDSIGREGVSLKKEKETRKIAMSPTL